MLLPRRRFSFFAEGYVAIAVAVTACNGNISNPDGKGGAGELVDEYATPARVRRLTRAEYAATVNALVPNSAAPPIDFPDDPIFNGYTNKSDHLRITSVLAQNLWAGAPGLADEAAKHLLASPPCNPGPGSDEACVEQILRSFTRKAYRHDPNDDEIKDLMDVYRLGRGTGANGVAQPSDYLAGLTASLTAVYQSADFMYHTELGDKDAPPGVVQMTSEEIAEQMAYLLTGAPPDDELLAGDLRSPTARKQQAGRLMALPQGKAALGDFAVQWTETANLANLTRDATVYPDWAKLRSQALDETKAFFGAAVVDDGAKLIDLFTANWTIASPDLTAFYGGSPGAAGRLNLPGGQRSGLLTQSSVLAAHAQAVDSSPIKRGHFVRVRLMCQTVPPPPPKLVITPPEPDPTHTNRERFAGHSSNPTCSTCHNLMDPIGYGLENFDAIGHYRDMDAGRPVDATGTINGGTDIDGPFNGPFELGQKLGKSPTAHQCFAQNWLEYSLARSFDEGLNGTITRAASDFLAGKGSVRDLMVALIGTNSFILRTKPQPDP